MKYDVDSPPLEGCPQGGVVSQRLRRSIIDLAKKDARIYIPVNKICKMQIIHYLCTIIITAMNIRRKDIIDDFIKNHVDAKSALQRWIVIVEKAEWKTHADIKADFPSADYVGKERYVFNIRGNNYRMVAVVIFIANSLTIRFLSTHNEYDKIDCKTI